jgi:hypothetical protein
MDAIALGTAVGLVFPATWQVALAGVQLRLQDKTPTRLLRFLEDAHERNVLRAVGQVYQFRHGKLQDHLAQNEATRRKADHSQGSSPVDNLTCR